MKLTYNKLEDCYNSAESWLRDKYQGSKIGKKTLARFQADLLVRWMEWNLLYRLGLDCFKCDKPTEIDDPIATMDGDSIGIEWPNLLCRSCTKKYNQKYNL
jgi:hypothetical protein